MRRSALQRLLLVAHAAVLLAAGTAVTATWEAPAAAPPTAVAWDVALPPSDDAADAHLLLPPSAAAPEAVVAAPVDLPAARPPARTTARADRAAPRARGDAAVPQRSERLLTPEQRGRQALSALRYPWQQLGYTVRFERYTGGRLGHADPRTRAITIYVKTRQDEVELRTTIAHELGHALDFEHGDDARRERYLEVRGVRTSAPWYPCAGCDDLGSPAGDWAEVFAAALVGTADFRSRLAGPPTAEQLRHLAPLFRVPAPARPARQEPAPEQEPEDDGLWPLTAV